jgi:hypothetical protein
MPGSLSQASPGGTSPRTTIVKNITLNPINPEVPGQQEVEKEVWVKGAQEEDNLRYKEFLRYMEEMREEARERLMKDEERKGKARQREESWDLMREAVKYLRENTDRWRERKIQECDKIREEDKRDRLAVAKEKKKRYGVKRLSKDENQKLTRRTEDRLEIAKAKENLWRQFRERKESEDKVMEEEEEDAWKSLKKGIMELEEERGNWREPTKEPRMIVIVRSAKSVRNEEVKEVTAGVNGVSNGTRGAEEVSQVREIMGPAKSVKNGEVKDVTTGVHGFSHGTRRVMEVRGIMMEAEDKVLGGGRGSISPEKTIKALFNNQSGVRERMIKMTGNEVRGMKEHVTREVIEVMGSVESVRKEEVKEVTAGVKEVNGVREVKEVMGSARNVEVKKVTAGVYEVSHGTREAGEVGEVMGLAIKSEEKRRRHEEDLLEAQDGVDQEGEGEHDDDENEKEKTAQRYIYHQRNTN